MNFQYNPSPGTQRSRTPAAIVPPPPTSSNQSNLLLAHATNTQSDVPEIPPGSPLGAIVSGMGTFNNLDDLERFLASTSTAHLQSMLSSVEGHARSVHYALAANAPPVTRPPSTSISPYSIHIPRCRQLPSCCSLHRHILVLRLKIINKRWPATRHGLPLILRLKIINSLWLATIQPIQKRPSRAQVGPVASVVPLPALSILTDQQPPWTSLAAFRANVVMQEPSMDADGLVTERYLINVDVLATDPPAMSDTKAQTNETRTTLRNMIARFRVADNIEGFAGHHFAAPYLNTSQSNRSLHFVIGQLSRCPFPSTLLFASRLPAFLNMDYPTRDAFELVTLTVADLMARSESLNAGFGADIFRIRKMLLPVLGTKRQIPDGGVILVTYLFQNGYPPPPAVSPRATL